LPICFAAQSSPLFTTNAAKPMLPLQLKAAEIQLTPIFVAVQHAFRSSLDTQF
jgi:hypothetical protein